MKFKVFRKDGFIVEGEGTVEELERVLRALGTSAQAIETVKIPVVESIPSKFEYQLVDCSHEYPNPWSAVTPPPCLKCGKLAFEPETFVIS